MKKQIRLVIPIFLMICLSAHAQNSYQGIESVRQYSRGVLAFHQQNYFLAQEYFNQISTNKDKEIKDLESYKMLCAIALNEKYAGVRVASYLKENPFSVNKTDLILALANYYFRKKNTKTAFKWFKEIDVKYLTSEQEANYNYKLAFSNYRAENYAKAKQYLIPISKSGQYKNEANYYLANIAMQTKDFDTALDHLNKIKNVAKYERDINYQMLVIKYLEKDYNNVVAIGERSFPKAIGVEKSEMAKIIGESYFHLGTFQKALDYLSLYRGRRNRYTEVDYYFTGYALYQLKKYNKAIQSFNKITNEQTDVAQNAHYHLGDCYLKLNQKTQALNAFKNASEMTFDLDIQQDAFLNYAKLGYDIGNPYKSSSVVLQDFVNKYPNAVQATEIKSLIINAYLQYKDYQGAIDYYNQQKLLKDSQYQSVLLEKGFGLFNEYKYKEALSSFTEASEMFTDNNLKNKALFWKAETLSELNNYEQATYDYISFLNQSKSKTTQEYKEGVYGVAYSFFQQKKYNQALKYFNTYVQISTNDDKKYNAILRTGDCNYVSKDYWKALDSYNKIIEKNKTQVDYAMYQKALSYGFLGRKEEKKTVLESLQKTYRNSAYLDNSYYQLGNLYVGQNNTQKALLAYDNLINSFPKSPLVAKTELKKGLIFFNSGENEKAIKTLKRIVALYPETGEAVQAVKIAEQVYKDMDKVDLYAAWVKTLEFVNISDADIDKTMFEAVESRYLTNSLKETISSGKKYLVNFPNGINALVVNFYVAQSYYNSGDKQKAIPYYKDVIDRNTNEYSEIAVNRLSQIYLENQEWDLASPLLLRLEEEATNEQNKVYAQSNLMKYYFTKKMYSKALLYSDKVLNNTESSEQAVADAYVFGARSSIFTSELDKAKQYYIKLEVLGKGEMLAEANYYKALWLHNDRNYEKSNIQIQNLASKYQNYKYWGVKGLLLMAQNFHELKDDFQASFILKNVIENAEEFEDVTSKAKQLLEKYSPNNKEELKLNDDEKEEALLENPETEL